MEIKKYTFADYKRIAFQFLKSKGLPTKETLPIDIENLIDRAGFTIHSVPSMFRDFGVKGAVLKKIGGFDIAIDEDLYESASHELFFRFTLAEELSHILLHEQHVSGISSLNDVEKFHQSFSEEEYRRIEQQARALASQLLLPSHLFDKYILDWVDKNIEILRRTAFFSKMDLAEYIAESIYKVLLLSKDVIRTSILRHPDPVIDKVLSKYGESLIQ